VLLKSDLDVQQTHLSFFMGDIILISHCYESSHTFVLLKSDLGNQLSGLFDLYNKTFIAVLNYVKYQYTVFIPLGHFHPSLLFASTARSLPLTSQGTLGVEFKKKLSAEKMFFVARNLSGGQKKMH
jgi:hypothetical protein